MKVSVMFMCVLLTGCVTNRYEMFVGVTDPPPPPFTGPPPIPTEKIKTTKNGRTVVKTIPLLPIPDKPVLNESVINHQDVEKILIEHINAVHRIHDQNLKLVKDAAAKMK